MDKFYESAAAYEFRVEQSFASKLHLSSQALPLLLDSFPGEKSELEFRFRDLFSDYEDIFFTTLRDKQKLIGILTLIKNTLIHDNHTFNGVTLSYMAVDRSYPPGSISKIFKYYVKDELYINFDYIIGFPRKSMRGFWEFQGFASKTISNAKRILLPIKSNSSEILVYEIFNEDKIDILKYIYDQGTRDKLSYESRSDSQWKRIFFQFKNSKFLIYLLVDRNKVITGYLIMNKDEILELIVLSNDKFFDIGKLNILSNLEVNFIPYWSLVLNGDLLKNSFLGMVRISETHLVRRDVVFRSKYSILEKIFMNTRRFAPATFPTNPLAFN